MPSLTIGQGIFDMLRPVLQADRPADMQRKAYYEIYILATDMALGDWLQLIHQNPDVIREANRIAVEQCIGKEPFIRQPSTNNQPITEEVKVSEKIVSRNELIETACAGLAALTALLKSEGTTMTVVETVQTPVTQIDESIKLEPSKFHKPKGEVKGAKLAQAQPEHEVKVETATAPVVEPKPEPVAQAAKPEPEVEMPAPITKEIISQKIMGTFPGMKKAPPREAIFAILAKVGGAGCTKISAIPESKYPELNAELDTAIAAL